MGSNDDERPVRIGDVHNTAFSIGGSNNRNTVNNGGGTGDRAPGAEELLEAVRDLRAALVRLPRSTGRGDLDAELDGVAEELEDAEQIPQGLPARLRGALVRWAPLVESLSAATALGGLLTSLGG
ncbi:hypothetical protein [Streptomyces sp. NBC_00091]|uniref:hypothetical protein n=1 Tax=Streptomyces sp. NBC_00091 TaxID=2975648 RepID=UPI00225B8A09|nr:hypothetical protein [Streptomyces sp. NBC_00091]MCX5376393.1 hypothetical protein [Streptomyces sp. NBC_00091]